MKTKRVVQLLLVLALAFGLMAAGTISASAATKTPKQVTGVKVTAAKDTSISLSWSKATYAKKYEVQYKKSTDKKWKSKKTSSRKITIKSLKADTKYNFKVRGINGSKKGKFSKTVTQKTYKTPGKVDPDSMFASERTKNQITLEWGEAKNASWYEIAIYRLDGSVVTQQQPQSASYKVQYFRLYPNTWYGFKVRTVNADTGKFPALKSSWTDMYYTCTTTGYRVITGEKDAAGVIKYEINDTFDIGSDDPLVPTRVTETFIYGSEDEIQGVYYDSDYMKCPGVYFPSSFDDSDAVSDGSPSVQGHTLGVGDSFAGSKISAIYVEAETSDEWGVTGYKEVVIETADNRWIRYAW